MNTATHTAPDYRNAPEAFLGLLGAYLRAKDPTEYYFAKEYFGTWAAWEEFSSKEEIAPVIGQWRRELTQKLRSDALGRILEAAQGETRDALSANKYIYEALNEDKANKVGRPTKEAIMKEASRMVDEDRQREEAYNRLLTTSSFLSNKDTKENKI